MLSDVTCSDRTGKTIKNGFNVFQRGENLLENGVLHFVFRLSQSSEIAFEFMQVKKNDFWERGAFKWILAKKNNKKHDQIIYLFFT